MTVDELTIASPTTDPPIPGCYPTGKVDIAQPTIRQTMTDILERLDMVIPLVTKLCASHQDLIESNQELTEKVTDLEQTIRLMDEGGYQDV